jgi:hypothetical protein
LTKVPDENQGQGQTGTANGQSSSQSDSQAQSAQAQGAQGAASSSNQTNQGTSAQSSQAQAPSRPEGLADKYWDAAAGVKITDLLKDHTDLATFKAAEDSRRLSRPQKPEEYKTELPKEFQKPDGIDFQFDDKSDTLKSFREFALKRGLDQDTFSEALSIYAGMQLHELQQMKTARDAEIAKLGNAASARVDAVTTWIKGMVGDDGLNAVKPMLVTSRIVKAFEGLIQKFSSQGGAQFSQAHRDISNGKPTDDQWTKMSYKEKLEYVDRAKSAGAH